MKNETYDSGRNEAEWFIILNVIWLKFYFKVTNPFLLPA